MNRFTLALSLLAPLCACRANDYDRDEVQMERVATNAATARSDPREPRTSLSSDDKKFIEKAALMGMFEVQSSRVAQLKNISRDTLDFAQMMVDDHGEANRDLDRIATEKGVIPPTRLDSMHERKLDDLKRLDGQEFELAYRDAQVVAHDDAIEHFERNQKEVDDPELRSYIQRVLPTLREHKQHLMEKISSK